MYIENTELSCAWSLRCDLGQDLGLLSVKYFCLCKPLNRAVSQSTMKAFPSCPTLWAALSSISQGVLTSLLNKL